MLRSGREEDGPGPANADKAQRVTNDDIERVDRFIRSSSHWCYFRMLQSINCSESSRGAELEMGASLSRQITDPLSQPISARALSPERKYVS